MKWLTDDQAEALADALDDAIHYRRPEDDHDLDDDEIADKRKADTYIDLQEILRAPKPWTCDECDAGPDHNGEHPDNGCPYSAKNDFPRTYHQEAEGG